MPNHAMRVRRAALPPGYRFGDAHEHYFEAHFNPEARVYRAICRTCGHVGGECQGLADLETRFGVALWDEVAMPRVIVQ